MASSRKLFTRPIAKPFHVSHSKPGRAISRNSRMCPAAGLVRDRLSDAERVSDRDREERRDRSDETEVGEPLPARPSLLGSRVHRSNLLRAPPEVREERWR